MKKQKDNISKYLRALPNTPRSQLFVLLGAFLMVAVVYVLGSMYTEKNDFSYTQKRLDYVKIHLEKATGLKITTVNASYCFHNEQKGTYDDGNRYCGKAVYGTYVISSINTGETVQAKIYKLLDESQVFGGALVDSPREIVPINFATSNLSVMPHSLTRYLSRFQRATP